MSAEGKSALRAALDDSQLSDVTVAAQADPQLQQQPEFLPGQASDSEPLGNAAALTQAQLPMKEQLLILWSRPIYVWTVFSLSALYFVVTGIQYWITPYLVEALGTRTHWWADISLCLGADLGVVGGAFVVCSLTAPTAGVVIGNERLC